MGLYRLMTREQVDAIPLLAWEPTPQQLDFLLAPHFELLAEGERGGGKSDVLLVSFGRHVGEGFGPAWKGVIFRNEYKDLEDIVAKSKKIFRVTHPKARFLESTADYKWIFPDGEELLFRVFKDERSYWSFHGQEIPFQGWDELTRWASPTGYLMMQSCCRSSVSGVPRMIRSTTNPYGVGHNWVKARWRLPVRRNASILDGVSSQGLKEPPRASVHITFKQNYHLSEKDPEYLERVSSIAANEAMRRAWRAGDWDVVAGGMFDDVWDPRVHRVPPFTVPQGFSLTRSFDWGSSAPFSVGLWAVSDGRDLQMADRVMATVRGDAFRIGEWYGWNGEPNKGLNMSSPDITRGIIEREIRMGLRGRFRPGPADTQIFTRDRGPSISDEMARPVRMRSGKQEQGVRWLRADKSGGSRARGWQQIRDRLEASKPVERGARERPGMFVVEGACEQWERTVPTLPRDDKDLDDVPDNVEDHAGDDTRYLISSLGSTGRVRTGMGPQG